MAIPEPSRVVIEDETRAQGIEVRSTDGDTMVTWIEILSPGNKGQHWPEYCCKRRDILDSATSLVEIDLLREGPRLPNAPDADVRPYYTCVHRAYCRNKSEFFEWGFKEPIGNIAIPLTQADGAVAINLGACIHRVFATREYRLAYAENPQPALPPDIEAWADAVLQKARKR